MLEVIGAWLSRLYAVYAIAVLLGPAILFLDWIPLAAAARAMFMHAHGRPAWFDVGGSWRRGLRLAVELAFGLINPILYLSVLATTMPELTRRSLGVPVSTLPTLAAVAWTLLVSLWSVRLFGSAVAATRPWRRFVQALLLSALAVLLIYTWKDAYTLAVGSRSPWQFISIAGRVAPLYLLPALLIVGYLRAAARGGDALAHGFFLLRGTRARACGFVAVGLAIVTVAAALHRRSDSAVRDLVRAHRASIRSAGERYGVDPKLVASIIYVTHRDQLSPFRDSLERIVMGAWATNLRGQFRMNPPDDVERLGPDESPLLNNALDMSVGIAQIKPRTAQTATVLAVRRIYDSSLPYLAYRGGEPHGGHWNESMPDSMEPSIPVPSTRRAVALALLDDDTNIATCAMILALYQHQWESASPARSLRDRPDILATLYQLGFARSKPHANPQPNAFGTRVREIYMQPWMGELLATSAPR